MRPHHVLVALSLALSGCGAGAAQPASDAAGTVPTEGADALFQRGRVAADRGDSVRAEQYITLAIERGYPRERALPLLLRVCLSSSRLLPIQVDGGTTDVDGNAHVLLSSDSTVRDVTVSLDTTTHPELAPKNPHRVYELSGRDAVLLFEPAFATAPLKRTPSRTPPAPGARPRHVPYRID